MAALCAATGNRKNLTSCRADDLIPEETPVVQTALQRLPPKEAYDRVFRLRRAFQVRSMQITGTMTRSIDDF
jgi:hypothetical protein